MKRTTIKRKTPLRQKAKPWRKAKPEIEATQSTYTPRPRKPAQPVLVADGRARMVVPVPKAQPLRDEDYRRLVASLDCICCGAVGHSQCAHANSPAAGKAGAMRADDRETFPLCTVTANDCHGGFDQRAMFSKEKRRELEPLWANQTRMTLRKLAEGNAKVRAVVERCIGL